MLTGWRSRCSLSPCRDSGRELLYAVIAKEYEDIVLAAAPGIISLDEERIFSGGGSSQATIFTGTLGGTTRVSNGIQLEVNGAASYPASESRELAEVSYLGDDGANATVRSRIDSRFYPGDEAVFLGGQKLWAHHVVITVGNGTGFMEVRSGF